MATTGTSLPRKLNPETGEWEVENSTTTNPGVAGPSGTPDQPSPLPAPVPGTSPSTTIGNPGGPSWPGENGPAPAPTTAPTAAATLPTELTYQGMTRDDQQRWIENYLSSKGGDPTKSPYWMGKLALGWDIPYFMSKLEHDESIPGATTPGPSTSFNFGSLLSPAPTPQVANAPEVRPESWGPVDSNQDAPGGWNNSDTDPYAWIPGGGVRLASGLWVPSGSGLASGPRWQAPAPTQAPTPQATSQTIVDQAPTPPPPTPTPPVAKVEPTSPVAPQVPITTANPTATEVSGLVNRPENVDIQMLLNAGSTNPDAPSTTNPATFNPASAEVLAKTPENTAFRLGQQRAEERQRAQLAERDAATGRNESGGQEGRFAGLAQARGANESQFLGQLAITKMQQAREDLVNGIQFALSNQQFDKAQGLQRDLAQLNLTLQEKLQSNELASRKELQGTQLSTEVSQNDKDRALQELLANKNVTLQEKLAAIQAATTERGQSLSASTSGNALTENARQYNLGLGFQYLQLQQQANMQAALAALQGWG